MKPKDPTKDPMDSLAALDAAGDVLGAIKTDNKRALHLALQRHYEWCCAAAEDDEDDEEDTALEEK
jgi:hypothetical protein